MRRYSLLLSMVVVTTLIVALFYLFSTTTRAQSPTETPPLGEIVFASNRDGDYDIYVMNSAGEDIRQLTNDNADDVAPQWSPDGTQIAFVSRRDSTGQNASLYLMDADGDNTHRLTTENIGITDSTFDWSPDGSHIVFSFDPNYVFDSYTTTMELYAVDVESGEITQITHNEAPEANPKWSPDGGQIAYLSYVDVGSGARFPDLYVVDADGENVRRLTVSLASDVYPSWSADGSAILFISYGSDGANIMLMDLESQTMSPVTTLDLADCFDPQWSPDEAFILFENRYFGESLVELAIMDADGQDVVILATNEVGSFNADWSPDGMQVVYVSDDNETGGIYVVNVDGSNPTALTTNAFNDVGPRWRPVVE